MADSNIGSLPQAQTLDDDSLLVAEQQGTAVKVTGAQFKEFGRQAVIGQVQGYVDQAEAAADRAVSAVSAVTDMTVEASTLASGQNATVTKTTKDGKVNLAFGLPRGEQGIPGPEGQTGPRGPQGPTGKGLTILGYYDTLDELKAAVPSPDVGDAYGVGLIAPYNIYVFDSVTNDWKDNGQLSGGGGGVLPEDVVTSEGGASLEYGETIPAGEHTILFTEEEDAQLEAADIAYDTSTSGMTADNVQGAIDELFTSVSDGKSLIASAITDKGVPTAEDATFQQMADNIGQISGGGDTSDATATSFDILAPKTAYTAAGKVEGVIPTLLGQTIMPGTEDKALAGGQYLGGTQVIKGDANLTPGNIKSGVTLFGVDGTLDPTFSATLTVTADAGAVVTAKHTSGTELSALSVTGTVVFELPLEGVWSVTAQRGTAQYNTVTITVSSSFSASLTAEVHVERVGAATPLSVDKYDMSAARVGNYLLFAGGMYNFSDSASHWRTSTRPDTPTEVYDENLTHSTAATVNQGRYEYSYIHQVKHGFSFGASASLENHALFAGGTFKTNENNGLGTSYNAGGVSVFDSSLTKTELTSSGSALSVGRRDLAGISIGGHALFAGGYNGGDLNTVDAFSDELVRSTPTPLRAPSSGLYAALCAGYAVFAGGTNKTATAYNEYLTRTNAASLASDDEVVAAASAGNYGLFAHKNSVEAYDAFLTRTVAPALSVPRSEIATTNNATFAIFAGGYLDDGSVIGTVDVYDAYLTRTTAEILNPARGKSTGGTIGNYALFAGGSHPNYYSYETSDANADMYEYV